MEKLRELYELPYLDDNMKLYIRRRYLFILLAAITSVIGSIETKLIFIFILFFVLTLICIACVYIVLTLCKKDIIKVLDAECIERVRMNLKERIFRSYYIFQKDNLYYKVYYSRKRYRPGNKVLFYLKESDVIYENDDTFIINTVLLSLVENTKNPWEKNKK